MPQNNMQKTPIMQTGLVIGLAGGLAEVAVVLAYEALTGGNVENVTTGISNAFGLAGGSASQGVAIHMLLAVALGVGLVVALRSLPAWARSHGTTPFMLASLAAVWAINFFVVLPVVSPAFVHLLPFSVTLGSKLASARRPHSP